MSGLEIIVQNLLNLLPFLKHPMFWVLSPMILFFVIKILKMIYRGMVHILYWILLGSENRRLKKRGEDKVPYGMEWYEDDEEENPKIQHKYWW